MAKHGKLLTNLEYLAARVILTFLGLMPPSVAMKFGGLIGKIGYSVAGNLRRTGETNLKLAFPDKTEPERTRILRACFGSLGRELGLFSQLSIKSPEMLRHLFELHGLEHLEAAKSRGNGAILFTAHLGAWELTSFSLSMIGQPLSFLVRRIDNPKVEQFVDNCRRRFGNQTLDKLAAARSMIKILRSGEALGLLLDLNTLDEEGIFVDFFGVPASTNFVVAKLALRTNAAIVPMFAPWNDDLKKFAVSIHPPVPFELSGNEEDDVRNLTAKLSLVIEEQIRRFPEQWLWIHKRWKTRPKGDPGIY